MWLTLIVLPDGTEIFSGPGDGPKIQNAKIRKPVNDSKELSIGSVCSSFFECTLLNPGGAFSLKKDDEIAVYRVLSGSTADPWSSIDLRADAEGALCVYKNGAEVAPVVDENGDLTWPGVDVDLVDGELELTSSERNKNLVGKYIIADVARPTPNKYQITAYDRIYLLEKDLTEWVSSLTGWPYSLGQLIGMVSHECGTGIGTELLMNADYKVHKFTGSKITGRKIMKWIGQLSATFCHANPNGSIALDRYKRTDVSLGPADTFSVKMADYETSPIERVQIRAAGDDVGIIYPSNKDGGVTYIIEGNPLVSSADKAALEQVAQNIYGIIKTISYTPGTVVIERNPEIMPGDIITVQDKNGKTAQMYIMQKTVSGQKETLECFGSSSVDSAIAKNDASYKSLENDISTLRSDMANNVRSVSGHFYDGASDSDESGIEDWLSRILVAMPDLSGADIAFRCVPVSESVVFAQMHKCNAECATVFGSSCDGHVYHKTLFSGIWSSTKKGTI